MYHPDVRSFEVTGAEGRHVGLFLADYFSRPSKRSGAWMSGWRDQHKLDPTEVRPIIVNVMNFAKGAPGEPALLSIDDARTLFHEFGHGLHGLLSNVTYPAVSGTSVERDFVELPSQLYEHWMMHPQVLKKFGRHYKTGKPVPESLLKKIKAARNFNQGFATVEYVAAAIVDLDLHVLEDVGRSRCGCVREGRPWARSVRRPRSACAIASPTSSTSSAAMRPATTATCGRR